MEKKENKEKFSIVNTTAYYATTRFGSKVIFMSTMYLAGGAIIAVTGLAPVVIIGTALLLS